MTAARVTFQKPKREDFVSAVREKASLYFKEHQLSRHATLGMHLKVACFILLIPFFYTLIITESLSAPLLLVCAACLGIAQILVTINLGHDALHGSFTASPTLNRLLGYCFDFVGLNSYIWKLTHNGGHHTYTNIHGIDPDIDKPFVLRLSPHEKWRWFHRYQHLYTWVLYALIGINWLLFSDFVYWKRFAHKFNKAEIMRLFGFKILNLSLFLFVPLFFLSLPVWQIVFGYLTMQAAGGFTAAVVFQLAHIVSEASFPLPNANQEMPLDWGAHQMATTCNFGTHNPFLNFIFGGLNFQIEHHLLPFVAHAHYPAMAKIVKSTAEEFGLPYYENSSFYHALRSHFYTLKRHGEKSLS